ncbi:unnamed protein product, partial [Protopolystoma xenopodis]
MACTFATTQAYASLTRGDAFSITPSDRLSDSRFSSAYHDLSGLAATLPRYHELTPSGLLLSPVRKQTFQEEVDTNTQAQIRTMTGAQMKAEDIRPLFGALVVKPGDLRQDGEGQGQESEAVDGRWKEGA